MEYGQIMRARRPERPVPARRAQVWNERATPKISPWTFLLLGVAAGVGYGLVHAAFQALR